MQSLNTKLVQMIDKATSNDLSAPNTQYNTEIINEINSKADMARETVKIIKKKLMDHKQPKSVFLCLIFTDMAMQKCGQPFHVHVGTKEFMNVMVSLLHNKDLMKEIHNKVLGLIKSWGERFEKDHDIMPLFSDVYKALKNKGMDFSDGQNGPSGAQSNSDKKQPERPNKQSSRSAQKSNKKQVQSLAPKQQKIIKELNLLKGNINMTNELLDNCRSRQELKENTVVLELLKAMKEMEPKLHEKIQSQEDEDITACCLLVNEDMQKTFQRFKAIKAGNTPEAFIPGEYQQLDSIEYLEPTHYYGQDTKSSGEGASAGGAGNGEVNLLDMMAGPVNPAPQQQQQQQPPNADQFGSGNGGTQMNRGDFGTSNNDPVFQLENILKNEQQQQQQQKQQQQFQMQQQQMQQQQFQTQVPMQQNNFYTGAPNQMQMGGQGYPMQQQNMGIAYPQQNMGQFQTQQQMPQASNPFDAMGPNMGQNNMIRRDTATSDKNMPQFLKEQRQVQKQEAKQAQQKSDLTGLLEFNPNSFNIGVEQNIQQSSGSRAGNDPSNPFDNSAGANSGYGGSFTNADQQQAEGDFGDLFKIGMQNKDKPANNVVFKNQNSYSYNPVQMSAAQQQQQQQKAQFNQTSQQQPSMQQPVRTQMQNIAPVQASAPPQQQNFQQVPEVKPQQVIQEQKQDDFFAQVMAPQSDPVPAPQMPAATNNAPDPFTDMSDNFAALGLNNEPAKLENNAIIDNTGFDFGGAPANDPGVGAGNDIFGDNTNQDKTENSNQQFDSYFDPFADFGTNQETTDNTKQNQNAPAQGQDNNDLFQF